jgi:hypothetical protein
VFDESDAAPIVGGEATLEEATRRTNEELKKEVGAEAKDIERAITRAQAPRDYRKRERREYGATQRTGPRRGRQPNGKSGRCK